MKIWCSEETLSLIFVVYRSHFYYYVTNSWCRWFLFLFASNVYLQLYKTPPEKSSQAGAEQPSLAGKWVKPLQNHHLLVRGTTPHPARGWNLPSTLPGERTSSPNPATKSRFHSKTKDWMTTIWMDNCFLVAIMYSVCYNYEKCNISLPANRLGPL